MKVTVVLIVFGVIKSVYKGLEKILKELVSRGKMETIQSQARSKSNRILSRDLVTKWGVLLFRLLSKIPWKELEKPALSENKLGVHSAVTKGFVQGLEDLEIRGRVETNQTSTMLRLA